MNMCGSHDAVPSEVPSLAAHPLASWSSNAAGTFGQNANTNVCVLEGLY